jgi:DNA ligase-4
MDHMYDVAGTDIQNHGRDPFVWGPPQLGSNLAIMNCEKARSTFEAFSQFRGQRVAVEVKYDGERVQVHVDMSKPPGQKLTIFNKSKRNSTWEREVAHKCVC